MHKLNNVDHTHLVLLAQAPNSNRENPFCAFQAWALNLAVFAEELHFCIFKVFFVKRTTLNKDCLDQADALQKEPPSLITTCFGKGFGLKIFK